MDKWINRAAITLALVLLGGSVLLAQSATLKSPMGVLLLFVLGVVVSFGFVFFGSLKFDDAPHRADAESGRQP